MAQCVIADPAVRSHPQVLDVVLTASSVSREWRGAATASYASNPAASIVGSLTLTATGADSSLCSSYAPEVQSARTGAPGGLPYRKAAVVVGLETCFFLLFLSVNSVRAPGGLRDGASS